MTVTYYNKDVFSGDTMDVGVCNLYLNLAEKPIAATDLTVQLATIPAGTVIQKIAMHVISGEGASVATSIGDTAGASTWMATGANLQTTDTTALMGAAETNVLGKFYTSADKLLLTLGGAASTAKIMVMVSYMREPKYL